jgi:hypothetical protein
MKASILTLPTKKKPVLVYIAATTKVFCIALVVERGEEGHSLKMQHPIYFISEVFSDTKTCYPKI